MNKNLYNLKNSFSSIQTTLKNLLYEISQLKSYKIALESEVFLLGEELKKLDTFPHILFQSNNFDILNKVKDRLSREKKILLFNTSDSDHEDLNVSLKIGIYLLNDVSLSSIQNYS